MLTNAAYLFINITNDINNKQNLHGQQINKVQFKPENNANLVVSCDLQVSKFELQTWHIASVEMEETIVYWALLRSIIP